MRNQFKQMVDAGVASFKHDPVAGETPTQDSLVRTYNSFWGAASDSHMSLTPDGEYRITGHITQDSKKWTELSFLYNWGGIDWRQSGYGSLVEFLRACGYTAQCAIRNGEQCMILVKEEATIATDIRIKEARTVNSRIPVNTRIFEQCSGILENIFNSVNSLESAADKMNDSALVRGNNWFVYEDKLIGDLFGQRYILEMSSSKGIKVIPDNELQKLLDAEKLESLYLVKYNGYFKIASDDKSWSDLLNKNKYNSIKCNDYQDFTAPEWMDQIKYILATIN